MQLFEGYTDQGRIPRIVAKILNSEPATRLPRHTANSRLDSYMRTAALRVTQAAAKFYLRVTLRQLVDQWLDSGRESQAEKNVPAQRTVHRRPADGFALQHFIDGWIARHPPKTALLSGHLSNPPVFFQVDPPFADERLSPETAGIHWGQDLAGYWLIRLVTCPYQTRFACCTSCGRYFVYDRAFESRDKTFCTTCRKRRPKERVTKSRDEKRSRRIGAAATYWNRWEPGSKDKFKWVAEMASNSLREGDEFTRRFVTTNLAEIEVQARAMEKNSSDPPRRRGQVWR